MAGIETAGRIILIILSVSLGSILILFGALLALSPGKPRPVTDENGKTVPGSISEKAFVQINGLRQGMFIRGKDTNNPVLLFMHGGAGMPEYFLTQKYPTGLEEHFTLCWWDRRGAGLSYSRDIPQESINIEQMISDAIEVTHYLRNRFKKDKIYLMAHSGGSVFAIQLASRAPELFAAYIGVGQITHQLTSEKLSWEYMLQQFKDQGNQKMVRKLEAASPGLTAPLPDAYMRIRDKAMHELGVGTTRDMHSVMSGVFLRSWLNNEYSIREKLGIWRGKFLSDKLLWNQMIVLDLPAMLPKLELPVYFLHGKYDHTVSYPLAKAYLDSLQAPLKGFYTFEHSAHSPMFEEPEKVKRILQEDILKGGNGLADVR